MVLIQFFAIAVSTALYLEDLLFVLRAFTVLHQLLFLSLVPHTAAIALSALSNRIYARLEAFVPILQHPMFVMLEVSLTVELYLAHNVFRGLIALLDHLIHHYAPTE